MPSNVDQLSYAFKCNNPQCGKVFDKFLRSLVESDVIFCPACWTPMDIREAKRTGDLGLWLNAAGELDKIDKLEKKK